MHERTPNDILPEGAGIDHFIRTLEKSSGVFIPCDLLRVNELPSGMAPLLDQYEQAHADGDDETAARIREQLKNTEI